MPTRSWHADSPTGDAAKAMTARANDIVQSAPAAEASRPQPRSLPPISSTTSIARCARARRSDTLALASAERQPRLRPSSPSNGESSTWDQTSLIGKIFIGFGALLTMASAARMFMA